MLRSGAAAFTALAALAIACSPPVSDDQARRTDELGVTPVSEGVFCDRTERPAATIFGAEPGETITFSSPMPIDIAEATADDDGRFQLMWQCTKSETQLSWELTVTGMESGRSANLTFSGSDRDPVLDHILIHEATTEAVLCDETTRTVGRLTNAAPNESITFTSPDANSLSPARAEPDGEVEVRWTCSPDEDGEDWRLTATGETSGRSVEFTITGQAPQPADLGDIVVEILEDPFVCDRGRRPVARLSNLTPNSTLEFATSPPGEPMRPGRAAADGSSSVFWQCTRDDDGTTWNLTVTEDTPQRRSATFTFGSATLENPVTVEITEDSIVCDGSTREFAVIRNFVPREAVGFDSPQSEAIRDGRTDEAGSLPVRWSCSADQIGTVWEITATGLTSGASVSFTITGVAP